MAWPRCPNCKSEAMKERANLDLVPHMYAIDRQEELTPAEDAVYRSYECRSCGWLTWTREVELAPIGSKAPFKYLRQ